MKKENEEKRKVGKTCKSKIRTPKNTGKGSGKNGKWNRITINKQGRGGWSRVKKEKKIMEVEYTQ